MSIQSEIDRLTAVKSDLKAAINGASGSTVGDVFGEYPVAVTSGKAAIAAAITKKGVATAADATFQQIAENIGKIESGGSTSDWVSVNTGTLPQSPPSGIQLFAPPMGYTCYLTVPIPEGKNAVEVYIYWSVLRTLGLFDTSGNEYGNSQPFEFYGYADGAITVAIHELDADYTVYYRTTVSPD